MVEDDSNQRNEFINSCNRVCVCDLKAKMEEFKCYYVGSRTSAAGNDGLHLRKEKKEKANMLQNNMMRTTTSSQAGLKNGLWCCNKPIKKSVVIIFRPENRSEVCERSPEGIKTKHQSRLFH